MFMIRNAQAVRRETEKQPLAARRYQFIHGCPAPHLANVGDLEILCSII